MAAGAVGGKGGAQTAFVLNLLTDLAFNLLIFFVVCASTAPEKGRQQQMPSSSKEKANEQKPQNIEINITRTTVSINGGEVPMTEFPSKMKGLLAGKTKPEERIVVVKSDNDTTYAQWIRVTGEIERAGGVITLQLEEEKEVGVR
jgi:biopolymer transport protein ExbD